MTFWQWVASNKAAILFAAVIIFGAMTRALPAKSADFTPGQFVIDWLKGIAQQLPSAAPKLTTAQRVSIGK